MTTDLTKIEKPFGLLTKAEKQALMALPNDQIEVYGLTGWCTLDKPHWIDSAVYRAKRNPRRFWLVGDRVAYEPVEGAIEVIEVPK